MYSISQEICTRFLLCFALLWQYLSISIRLTSLALWQSNDCPSASKATLMNMDKYFMWIHYERLHNHNKAKHNKTVCIFLGIHCTCSSYENVWHGIQPGDVPICLQGITLYWWLNGPVMVNRAGNTSVLGLYPRMGVLILNSWLRAFGL